MPNPAIVGTRMSKRSRKRSSGYLAKSAIALSRGAKWVCEVNQPMCDQRNPPWRGEWTSSGVSEAMW